MLNLTHLGALLGGIGLFLLGMWLMTEGLRLAAGAALRDVLAHSTRTRWRALLSGMALTAVVQSSSAVTVAAIGFVNAGLLSLGQVLWVLFGSNVGTTLTGWLVALLGLKIQVDVLALPMIGLGMVLRLTGGQTGRGHLGLALAGFGVLFLGIDVLRNAFSGLAVGMQFPQSGGALGVLAHVLAGVLLTLLMQSSSAATALVLTAAQGGMVGLEGAAAVVIGANIGTTGTAMIAALGATANARRAAAAHVVFNVLTGAVALLALPWLLQGTQWLAAQGGAPLGIATVLALFHTVFNLLGVLLMWPLSDRLAAALAQRFRSSEEDQAKPHYLDAATAALPALAVDALDREVSRLGSLAVQALQRGLLPAGAAAPELASTRRTVLALDGAIGEFVQRLNRAAMTQATAGRLAGVLRRMGYFMAVSELLDAVRIPEPATGQADADLVQTQLALRHAAAQQCTVLDPVLAPLPHDAQGAPALIEAAAAVWERQYAAHKAAVLDAAAQGRLAPVLLDDWLRANSALRRALQQATKAALAVSAATLADANGQGAGLGAASP